MRAQRLPFVLAGNLLVVAAFTALYVYMIVDNPPENLGAARDLAIIIAFPTVLWVGAVWLLVRHWWASTGARLSTMDPPGRLMAGAMAALPEHRRDWGAAMLAEWREVPGAWARRRFAGAPSRLARRR